MHLRVANGWGQGTVVAQERRSSADGGSSAQPQVGLPGHCGLGQGPPCSLTMPPHLSRPQDYVQALTGFCYDGVEGLIYLALFSFVTALMFSSIVCSVPHTWPQKR